MWAERSVRVNTIRGWHVVPLRGVCVVPKATRLGVQRQITAWLLTFGGPRGTPLAFERKHFIFGQIVPWALGLPCQQNKSFLDRFRPDLNYCDCSVEGLANPNGFVDSLAIVTLGHLSDFACR